MSRNRRGTIQDAHKQSFVVTKMAKADMLTEVRDSLQKALDEGKPFEEWKKEIVPKLEGKWLGRSVGELWDELSDEEKAKREPPSEKQREKIIAPERLELIFRTNMAVANAAGHYEQLMKTKAIYPYWRYVTRDDARVRDAHRALHNKVFKWDDPFWETYFPPNGFRCRCHVSPLTKRQAERDPKLHIEQSNIAEDANGRKVLDVGGSYYKNNPGWDYNPGDGVNHLVSLAKFNEKGRPAQVQADLEADLAKKEAEEAAAAKAKAEAEEKRKAEEQNKAKQAEVKQQSDELKQKAEQLKSAQHGYRKQLEDNKTLARAQEIRDRQQVLARSLEIYPNKINQDKVKELTQKQADPQRLLRTRARDLAEESKQLAAETERIAGKKEITADDQELVRKNSRRMHRLEQLQRGMNNRLERAEKALQKYPDAKEEKIYDNLIKQAGGSAEVAQNCALEHAIAKQEKRLLDDALKQALKANAPQSEITKLQTEADKLLRNLENSAQHAKAVASGNKPDPKQLLGSDIVCRDKCKELADYRRKATELHLRTMSAAERKKEEARIQQRQERQATIHAANADIFAGMKNAIDAKRKTKVMQREFDLMMYNFSDGELELYEGYSRHYVAVKDPKDKNYTKNSDNPVVNNYLLGTIPVKSRADHRVTKTAYWPYDQCCYIKFIDPGREQDIIDGYKTRFAWYNRFHEEFHHLDAIFGSDYSDKHYNIALTNPNYMQGRKFQEALMRETLGFINSARKKANLPEWSNYPDQSSITTDDIDKMYAALLDHFVDEQKQFTTNNAFSTLMDQIGLCSHGVIDCDGWDGYRKRNKNRQALFCMVYRTFLGA